MCLRFAWEFAVDVLVVCDGFVSLAAAASAHAQTRAIDLFKICLGLCYGFACDL